MKTLLACLLLAAAPLLAGVNKPFPAHWGQPPRIETRDLVPLPDGYGTGSSTLRGWITQNLEKDAKTPAPAGTAPAFQQNFDALAVGALPEGDFMVLAGEFAVAEEAGAKFMELPGAPLDTFSVMFGPGVKGGAATVRAKVFGTTKSRRQPTFAVGLGGASPWKLVVAPGKNALELWRDDQFKATTPWNWKTGTWTALALEIKPGKEGEWLVRGKAWDAAATQPAEWLVEFTTTETPPSGRASVWGSPFAGTPLRYDDLVVFGTPGK